MSKPKIVQIIKNILYATIGVQNSETSNKEFEQASATAYIVAGVVAVAVFVGFILLIVSLVI